MPRLVYSSEKHGQGATIELDSKEVVVCSIAQKSVLVYLYNNKSLIGSIISNFWGARLYNQRDVYKNAQTAQALSELYADVAEPLREFKNPALRVFANAIWHCGSAAEVCTVLNEAAGKLPALEHATPRATEPPKLTVEDVVSAYGALIEKYPLSIMDVSMLPLPKQQMKIVLKSLYAKVTSGDLQNFLTVRFTLLSQFQEGVGSTPIDGGTKFKGELPTKAELANLDKWLKWQSVSAAEMESLSAEWKRFLAGEPI
jgi:hypothetical protein